MPWQEGATNSFSYYDWNNNFQTTTGTELVHSGPVNTSDPNWIGNNLWHVEWLQYRNSNDQNYQARIHCETIENEPNTNKPIIRPWAETKYNGRTNGDMPGILIKDDVGSGWNVEFLRHAGQDLGVTFYLHHAILPGY